MMHTVLREVMKQVRKTISLAPEQSQALEQIMDPASEAHAAFRRLVDLAEQNRLYANEWSVIAGETVRGRGVSGWSLSPFNEDVAGKAEWPPGSRGEAGPRSEADVLRLLISVGLEQVREVRLEMEYQAIAAQVPTAEEEAEVDALLGFAARAWADDD
jgi:hypothetical protein